MRLIIISNRLPITAFDENGKIRVKPSIGGVTTGLVSYIDSEKNIFPRKDCIWFGWPGITIDQKKQEEFTNMLVRKYNYSPIFLNSKEIDDFYLGYCNKTLWPLFHYFPEKAIFEENLWEKYKIGNEIFCHSVLSQLREDDVVWIHDYHLLLLPQLIRKKFKNIFIGLFLHIPFPSFDVYRLLSKSWRSEILEGMLGADLIGFHTNNYKDNFLNSVKKTLGYKSLNNKVILNDRSSEVGCFPMGIDYSVFQEKAESKEVILAKNKIKRRFGDKKLILSIDRLDYTKGIINRLEAFEQFLSNYPKWHKKVVLILFVVPSRTKIDSYKQMKVRIDELVGKINGTFSDTKWNPICYQYKELNFNDLVIQYAAADIALITPLRDGMNLICKEYIASRIEQNGVLILSEMAGASEELLESIIVNPYNINELMDALIAGLVLSSQEQANKIIPMQKWIKENDIVKWAEGYLGVLLKIKVENISLANPFLGIHKKEKVSKEVF